MAVAGFYLVRPILGGQTKRFAAAPAASAQQKERWRTYVELSMEAEKESQNANLQLKLARAQRDLGLAKQALGTYRKVIYLNPESRDAHYELGLLAVGLGDTKLAAAQAAELARQWPGMSEADVLQAHIELRGGHEGEALARLRLALGKNPDSHDIRRLLILTLNEQHRYAEAAQAAEAGLQRIRHAQAGTVNSSDNILRSGKSAGSLVFDLTLQLARSQTGLKRYADAEATLRYAAGIDPASPVPLIALGDLQVRRGSFQAALVTYEEALLRDPDNDVLLNNIACLSADHGFDLERAATLAARMYAKYPGDPAPADTLGWVLFNQGKLAQALPLLRFAAGGMPRNPTHRYHYGAALLKDGQTEAGRKELAAALQLSGGFDGAEKARTLLEGRK